LAFRLLFVFSPRRLLRRWKQDGIPHGSPMSNNLQTNDFLKIVRRQFSMSIRRGYKSSDGILSQHEVTQDRACRRIARKRVDTTIGERQQSKFCFFVDSLSTHVNTCAVIDSTGRAELCIRHGDGVRLCRVYLFRLQSSCC
jgi:hypothetical protein